MRRSVSSRFHMGAGLLAAVTIIGASGCSLKPGSASYATIKIDTHAFLSAAHLATARGLSSGPAIEAIDCIAVNVSAADIQAHPLAGSSCINSTAQVPSLITPFVPLVGAAGELTLSVPTGPGRRIQVLGMKMPASGVCPGVEAVLGIPSTNPNFLNPVELGYAQQDVFADASVRISAAGYDENSAQRMLCSAAPAVVTIPPAGATPTITSSISYPITVSGATAVPMGNGSSPPGANLWVDMVTTGDAACDADVSDQGGGSYTLDFTSCTGNGTVTWKILAGAAENVEGAESAETATRVFNVVNAAILPATSLSWSGSSPANTTSLTATWTPSVSGNVGLQKIQYYLGSACTAPNVTGPEYTIGVGASSYPFTGVTGNTYVYKITTVHTSGVIMVDACSSPMTVDTTPPGISIGAPSTATIRQATSVDFVVTYTGANTISLSSGHVTVNYGGGSCSAPTVNGSGNTRTVSVTGCTGNGSLTIGIAAGSATDLATNSAPAAGPSTPSVLVDNAVTPASALSWAGSAPYYGPNLTAQWTPSSDSDLQSQDVLFFDNASCTSPASTTLSLGKVASSQVHPLKAGVAHSFLVRSLDAVGNSVDSACVPMSAATSLKVDPLYANAPNWNDYVTTAGTPPSNAICNVTNAGSYLECDHGGERRSVSVWGASSCSGLAITDSLGAFDWECSVVSGTATFISKGLREGHGLASLLNAGGTAWQTNSVTVTGISPSAASLSSAWWGNTIAPLVDNSATSTLTLTGATGTIYTLIASRGTRGYNLNADGLALVIYPGATLNAELSAGDNADSTTGEATGSPNVLALVAAGGQKHLWIEGDFLAEASGATSAETALLLSNVKFSRIHRATFRKSYPTPPFGGVHLTNVKGLVAEGMTALHSTHFGVSIAGSVGSRFEKLGVAQANADGILVASSTGNSFEWLMASGNGSAGLYLGAGADWNLFQKVVTTTNGFDGITLSDSDGNTLQSVVSANNGGRGVQVSADSDYNSLGLLTLAQNANAGVEVTAASDVTLIQNAVAANNTGHGIALTSTASSVTGSNLVSAHNSADGIKIYNATANTPGYHKFTGNLWLGNNSAQPCSVSSNILGAGITDTTCVVPGASVSDYNLVGMGLDLLFSAPTSAFAGVVTAGDAVNSSDTTVGGIFGALGSSTIGGTFDWFSFDRPFRAWGDDATGPNYFPQTAAQGIWSRPSGTGRIWDWTLVSAATNPLRYRSNTSNGSQVNAAFPNATACPIELNGADVLTSAAYFNFGTQPTMNNGFRAEDSLNGPCDSTDVGCTIVDGDACDTGETCMQRYLRNAAEMIGDGLGDDDGLCEDNEDCFYTPNFGAYQGHHDDLGGDGDGICESGESCDTYWSCTFTSGGPSGVNNVWMYGFGLNGY